jgi:asparagine N-glycosylation enzyme membrane subunit Stt3
MILAAVIVISLLIISSGFLTYYISRATHEPNQVGKRLISSDYVGGPNNATVEFYNGYVTDNTGYGYDSESRIVYQLDGMRVEGSFDPDMVPVLDWILNNTAQNATIVAWWDYGHSIRGYTGRNVIAVNPSKSIYPNTLWRPENFKVFDSDQKIADLSNVLIGDNENQTKELMGKYNASYILTTSRDLGISYAMFQGAKKDTRVYMDKTFWPTEKGKQTFLYKTWMGEGFGDLKLEYRDLTTRVYSL